MEMKRQEGKPKKSMFDPKNIKGNIDLFTHLNLMSTFKLKNKISQSESLNVQKR